MYKGIPDPTENVTEQQINDIRDTLLEITTFIISHILDIQKVGQDQIGIKKITELINSKKTENDAIRTKIVETIKKIEQLRTNCNARSTTVIERRRSIIYYAVNMSKLI